MQIFEIIKFRIVSLWKNCLMWKFKKLEISFWKFAVLFDFPQQIRTTYLGISMAASSSDQSLMVLELQTLDDLKPLFSEYSLSWINRL